MTDSGEFDARPVRAFLPGPDVRVDEIRVSRWPASVPALAQVLRDGLELPAGLTVLVGENGSGKSTVVETRWSYFLPAVRGVTDGVCP
jgi:ABC-type multidrug transport system fused ATPase/permease subunit